MKARPTSLPVNICGKSWSGSSPLGTDNALGQSHHLGELYVVMDMSICSHPRHLNAVQLILTIQRGQPFQGTWEKRVNRFRYWGLYIMQKWSLSLYNAGPQPCKLWTLILAEVRDAFPLFGKHRKNEVETIPASYLNPQPGIIYYSIFNISLSFNIYRVWGPNRYQICIPSPLMAEVPSTYSWNCSLRGSSLLLHLYTLQCEWMHGSNARKKMVSPWGSTQYKWFIIIIIVLYIIAGISLDI